MKRIIFAFVLIALAAFAWSETVYDIQYTTDPGGTSPLEGQIVTVSGIVTATNWYVSGNSNRFFISDPEGGEWHGIFVFNYDYEVQLGDEVELTAEVVEYYGFTELSNLESLTILSSGNPVPEPLEVTTAYLAQTEAYEGVLVQVNDVTVTAEPNNYGEAYITDGSGECQTDDAMFEYNPTMGAQYNFIRGIVDYSYDEYGLNPRFAEDVEAGGNPGFISGIVTLNGGSGDVSQATVTAGTYSINPGADGFYLLEVSAGTYDVTASLGGYLSDTIEDVVVEEGQNVADIDFTLNEIGETTIYDIQYTEDPSGDSPYIDQEVTVSGIVTGSGYNGNNFFFISSPEGGAWNGLYVYQYDYEVAQGDDVTITGTISEYYGFTELGNLTDLSINSSGNPLPAPVEITTAELASSEAYESVLVKVNDVIVTVEPNNYGEGYIDDGSGECQVDDGFVSNPNFVLGAEFLSITGIVDYSYDEYGLQPRSMDDFETGQNPELTAIYDIQYTEDPSGDSPYEGQVVIVNGIVTGANFAGDKFFMSHPDGGAWNGIYVFQTEYTVSEGDEVTVTGEVTEYYGFTEISYVSQLVIESSGNDLPDPIELTTADLASSEAYESVLVKVNNVEVTTEVNEYGECQIDDGSGECQLDDGFFAYPGLTVGDVFTSITGLVDYSYEAYALHPRYMVDFEAEVQPQQVTIYDIQYTEDPSGDSPYLDQLVEVSGIVTGAGFGGNNFFFISSPDGGAWNGLYVYQYDYEVAVGDEVTLVGVVSEYYGFTELGNLQELTINSSGNTLPETVSITTAELASNEAYEGVFVQVNDVEVTADPNDYGEAYIDDGSGECQLDDGFFSNPEVVVGAQFVSIKGLVDYSYDEYAIHPRNFDDFISGPQWIYGDITGDEMVDAFDAANILQYAVGMDPSGAPLPWTWQLVAGDVDGNENIEAYDAALILQFSVGIIDVFPVEEGRFTAPKAELIIQQENNELIFQAKGEFYSALISLEAEFTSPDFSQDIMHAVNTEQKKIALASSSSLSGELFRLHLNTDGELTIIYSVNGISAQQQINFHAAENITANQVMGVYPNPFNPQTSLKLAVKADNTPVKLNIFNVKGQLVETLFDGSMEAGIHNLSWNGSNAGSGIYFYQAEIGTQISSGKMIMLK